MFILWLMIFKVVQSENDFIHGKTKKTKDNCAVSKMLIRKVKLYTISSMKK